MVRTCCKHSLKFRFWCLAGFLLCWELLSGDLKVGSTSSRFVVDILACGLCFVIVRRTLAEAKTRQAFLFGIEKYQSSIQCRAKDAGLNS